MIFLNRNLLFATTYWRKMLMTMKLITILLFTGLMQSHASVFSQSTFSLNENNVTVKDMFRLIEKQSNYSIFFRQDQVDLSKKVTVNVFNSDINAVMVQVLKNQPLSFELINNMIVIKPKNANAQVITVTGIVTDKKGEPLPGVTIKIKGTDAGTITGINGSFSLQLTSGNETLVISYLGYSDQEIAVNGRTSLSINLEESTSALDEVVVIGYGTIKRRDLTGAVSSVKAEDIALSPVTSPIEALQGRVSGLDIQRGSGQAGEAPTVQLRGTRSLLASGSPLYIIDGMPSSINNLNPNDIESIEVLKDASSTAIYGSQGANGVIIITTKKAAAGKVQIDLNSYVGINGFASFPEPVTGEAWLDYKRNRFALMMGREATDLTDLGLSEAAQNAIANGQYTNWVNETLQTGLQQNHHISIRGGSEKTQAYLALGLMNEKGIYENDEINIYNSRGGVDVKFNDFFKAGFQSFLNYRKGNSTNSRVNKSYSIAPLGLPYNEDGTVNLYPLGEGTDVISILANNYPGAFANEGRSFNIQFNPYVELNFLKNFQLRSNFGATLSNGRTGNFQGANSYNKLIESSPASASYTTAFGYRYIWENILNYKTTIRKNHELGVTGITSWWDTRDEGSVLSGTGIDYEDFLFYNMGAVQNINARTNSYSKQNKLSFAGRINYSFKGKYLLQITNRWDGDSRLAEDHKWDSFPSVSAGWRISDENFMKQYIWLNNLKLRAGYGISGTAAIDPYSSLTRTANRTANLSLGGGVALPVYTPTQNIANPLLGWEKSANTNIGLDVSVLNNRIDFTAEYYFTETTDILWNRRLPTSSGGYDAKTPYVKTSNIATSENRGVEFTVSSRNIDKGDFKWNTSLTFTKANEKLTGIDLGNLTVAELISEGLFIGQTPAAEGVFYGYKKLGIWQANEATEAALYGAKPGDIKIQTVPIVGADGTSDNGIHAYSTKDRMIVGSNVPNFYFGVQNQFRYKNFDLTVFANGRYGQMINAQVLGYWNTEAQPNTYDYWTPENPTNDFPAPGSTFSQNFEQGLRLVDGSYFKIKNITLGYSLPNKIGQRFGVSNLRIYGTAYNPFVFTKSHLLKDVDPENGGADSFPLFKQIVFGINLSL